jgi:HAE1 family hydrophobic/amphiphilic exporter-1
MRQRSLTPKDVMNAIQRENAKVAAGQVGMPPTPAGQDFQLTVNVEGALTDVDQFERIIVKSSSEMAASSPAWDIGRVGWGQATANSSRWMASRPGAAISLPEASAGYCHGRARWRFSASWACATFPLDDGLRQESINESITLGEAGILVLLVLVFLQDWRASCRRPAGDDRGCVCRDGDAGLHDQPAYPFCRGAGHRYCC